MQTQIEEFLKSRHLGAFSVLKDELPYSFSAFYAYKDECIFIASDEKTTHMKSLKLNPNISGAIYFDTKIVSLIKGVQFFGEISRADKCGEYVYFGAYPFAKVLKPQIWQIRLKWIKMTDNKAFFGKKIIWEANLPDRQPK